MKECPATFCKGLFKYHISFLVVMIISVVFLFVVVVVVVLMTMLVLLCRFMIVSNTIDVNYGCDILLTLLSFLLQFMARARLTKSVENK